ncbi:MAG: ATP-binding protein, partial [Bacteroidota bacterium]
LERIVGHVVSNAIKFTDEGGVSLTLDSDAEHVYVRVTDTGSGMPPERLGHVQEAFTQQSSGHARSHEGVGLGLYIVAALTERMSGQLHIESEVGRGTTVSVSVPRFDRRGRTREQPRSSAVSAIARGVRLLCVQLDEHRDTAFADRLRKWAEVYVAPSLRTAVSAARLAPYDAVLVQTRQPARALAVQEAIRAVPGYEHIRCILIAETDRVETAAPLFAVLDPDTSSDTVASTIARATDPLALLHTADVSEAEA